MQVLSSSPSPENKQINKTGQRTLLYYEFKVRQDFLKIIKGIICDILKRRGGEDQPG